MSHHFSIWSAKGSADTERLQEAAIEFVSVLGNDPLTVRHKEVSTAHGSFSSPDLYPWGLMSDEVIRILTKNDLEISHWDLYIRQIGQVSIDFFIFVKW